MARTASVPVARSHVEIECRPFSRACCWFSDLRLKQYFKKVALGIAYACTIGGVSTKTGTGTNLAFSTVYSASSL